MAILYFRANSWFTLGVTNQTGNKTQTASVTILIQKSFKRYQVFDVNAS